MLLPVSLGDARASPGKPLLKRDVGRLLNSVRSDKVKGHPLMQFR